MENNTTHLTKRRLARRTWIASSVVDGFAWATILVSVIAAAVLVVSGLRNNDDGSRSIELAWVGAGVLLYGLIVGSAILMISGYVKTRIVDFVD